MWAALENLCGIPSLWTDSCFWMWVLKAFVLINENWCHDTTGNIIRSLKRFSRLDGAYKLIILFISDKNVSAEKAGASRN